MTASRSIDCSSFIKGIKGARIFCSVAIAGTLVAPFSARLGFAGPPASADNLKHGCFERHLNEAIEINKKRLPIYSRLSDGESEKTSKQLLTFEGWTVYTARYYFDWKAKKYQDQGIPIMCAEFLPMSSTAAFFQSPDKGPRFPRPVPELPKAIDTAQIDRDIRNAYAKSGFEGISDYLKPVIRDLESEGPYHCMTRHALESILRTSLLAPVHMEKAQTLGLPSTKTLSWNFIRAQMFILSRNNKIDTEAFPTQTAWGIPIICGDVPRIITPEQLKPEFRFTEEPSEAPASALPNP